VVSKPILKLNTNRWKIQTENGFEHFEGVSYNGEQPTIQILLTSGKRIEVTKSHILFSLGKQIHADRIKPGIVLDGSGKRGGRKVVSVALTGKIVRVFDVVHTESHTYLANGIKSHNCIFVSSDPLLIDSMKAQQLKHSQPISVNHGIKIWQYFDSKDTEYSPPVHEESSNPAVFDNWHRNPNYTQPTQQSHTYHSQCIMTVDPGKGVGGDFTVIEVFSYPALDQMMEFRSNISKTGEIYKILKYLWKKAENAGWEVMFTVENNGVGEGIVTLFENDETLPDNVEIINDEGKQIGMNTNGRTKFQACKIFKEFVESGKLKINSADLVREIKTFVATGGSYAAQQGSTDDCVTATLLTCRIVKQISSYDDNAYQKLYEVGELSDEDGFDVTGDDDFDEMPMVF
jgi:hypothetical protein